ncbi:F0F1 ATP synthase subunit B [Clostridium vincentii]|uniref:ATP synthase subunit b n=1 Tax=Clostridium vincentii TaxID=52704 RepID=A0A2T0BGW5_9CLOT|nr:F0F1 ATP synthase subunit B [Clostridium vincentii]PRR83150.1 ATP synthase subunit b, sodium ion specific [Clostridium vincentii]
MEALGLDPSTFILTLINFGIIILLLKHFLWDKIKLAIQDREDYTEAQIVKADEDSQKARLYLIENERILKSAKEEGKKIIEKKKIKATKIYDEILVEANTESKTIMERAKLEIEREREKAEFELKKHVVNLAIEISTKALEEKIENSKQRELINDFITKVGI